MPTVALLTFDYIWAANQNDRNKLVWKIHVCTVHFVTELVPGSLLRWTGSVVAQRLWMWQRNRNFSQVIRCCHFISLIFPVFHVILNFLSLLLVIVAVLIQRSLPCSLLHLFLVLFKLLFNLIDQLEVNITIDVHKVSLWVFDNAPVLCRKSNGIIFP